jgi:hypothetical protein
LAVKGKSTQAGWRVALLPLIMCAPFVIRRLMLLLTPQPLNDFMIYWSAGRLFVTGQNPYLVSAMAATERSLGWPYKETLVLLYPPWALPFVAPLGVMPFAVAHSVWLVLSIAIECGCALALWSYFGGERRQRWIALMLVATFLPAGTAEHMGQITPLILAGITGFLMALRKERYWLAGACLLLFGLKPHLLYLVLLAVLLWSVQQRKWSVPISAALSAGVASLVAIAVNREVLGFFRGSVGAALDYSCGVGGALRAIFGVQHVWLQFVPCGFGLMWFGWYWMRHRTAWRWEERMPLLLLVSISSAAYFWAHDFVLAIPAMIALAIQVARARAWVLAVAAYLLVQVAIMTADSDATKTWMSAASLLWLLLYWLVTMLCGRGLEGSTAGERQGEADGTAIATEG